MVRSNYRGNFVLVHGKVILLKGIYDEYTTGDGYGDGDYAYNGYPGIVLNWPKVQKNPYQLIFDFFSAEALVNLRLNS